MAKLEEEPYLGRIGRVGEPTAAHDRVMACTTAGAGPSAARRPISAPMAPAYLWQLRTGAKDNPTMRHLEALARFFEVSPSYFFDDELTEFPDTEVRQLVASRNETLRQMTVTLLGLSDESLNAVLNLACRLRQLEGLPSPD